MSKNLNKSWVERAIKLTPENDGTDNDFASDYLKGVSDFQETLLNQLQKKRGFKNEISYHALLDVIKNLKAK
jgi:hypothetical protein